MLLIQEIGKTAGGATRNVSDEAWNTVYKPTGRFELVSAQPSAPQEGSTPPAGATYISNLADLKGLTEADIWRDPNSNRIYKLQKATLMNTDTGEKKIVNEGTQLIQNPQTATDQQNNAIINAFIKIKGKNPTQEEINRFQGYYPDVGSLERAVQSYSPQSSSDAFGIIQGIAGIAAKQIRDPEQLIEEFLNTSVGAKYQQYKEQTLQVVREQNRIAQEKLALEQTRLQEDYQNLLSDINEGRVEATSNFARQRENEIKNRQLYIENQSANLTQRLDELNRGFIGREGLFSGVRQEGVGLEQSAYDRALRAYENARAMREADINAQENTALRQFRQQERQVGLAQTRGLQDIGQQQTLQTLQAPLAVSDAERALAEQLRQTAVNY